MTNRYQGVDPILTNLSIAYSNDEYLSDTLFPEVQVKNQSGKHYVYDRGRFGVAASLRGTSSPSNEVTLKLTVSGAYFAEDHALKTFVADEDTDNAPDPQAPLNDATEYVTDLLKVAKEIELATMLTDTAVMTQNVTLSGTSQFSDYTNSDPIGVIQTGIDAVHAAIHKQPNVMIMSRPVFNKLKNHPDLIERIKYTGNKQLTTQLMAELFDVEKVLIAGAGYNTAKEGQTESMGYIWGKHIVIAYIAPSPAKKTITLGITYRWKNRIVERLRASSEEDRKGTYVRAGNDYYDQKVVAASAGYLIKNAIA